MNRISQILKLRIRQIVTPQRFMIKEFIEETTLSKQYYLHLIYSRFKTSLSKMIRERSQTKDFFSSEEIKMLINQIILVLKPLYDTRYYHAMNIKASNVLIDYQLMYYLDDVGNFPLYIDSSQNPFVAPELSGMDLQEIQKQVTKTIDFLKADLYALGVTLISVCSLETDQELQIFKKNTVQAEQIQHTLL